MELEVLGEEYIPVVKAKKVLEESKVETHEVNIALEHATKFSKLKWSEAEKLIQELKSLDLRLNEKVIVKLVDIMPYDKDDVKLILSSYKLSLKDEDVEKILEVINKFRK
ncbi:MAG: DNA-directed RNA polymerase subunit F [Candidatus Nanoarchaeia archaeon]|nr:DNA-directed RNA polymerase subunit F [Candidatus Haiyanarchaeum thermophilum]MCW1302798.1 DNA-directed RNA polymerase subunit F [Candidatus Haiyanarchaeum thermophilum]MCW1303479.1 DNA-directed RNA polymerase subunit F [Candidatus Haiyanarchaeum thermophilum]MCW1306659.1 DNA-directed RNA polymerase subunit F [Candidatus Haiyanarchaeum thermophilum]MCW1307385.1 DNA-directed RNA polymerase subunit F [Candidatus Haiyanarchaeum thermophilum]